MIDTRCKDLYTHAQIPGATYSLVPAVLGIFYLWIQLDVLCYLIIYYLFTPPLEVCFRKSYKIKLIEPLSVRYQWILQSTGEMI